MRGQNQTIPLPERLRRHRSWTGLLVKSEPERISKAMGTTSYMSPEQVRGEKLDTRTGLFSFGLVLYEMTTARQAFVGESVAVVHEAILNLTPIPVDQLNLKLPVGFADIVNRALEKERELPTKRPRICGPSCSG